MLPVNMRHGRDATLGRVPYGTLDLMVLKTLETMGALHGCGIARRIEQVSRGSLALNQGTIYPAPATRGRRTHVGADGRDNRAAPVGETMSAWLRE